MIHLNRVGHEKLNIKGSQMYYLLMSSRDGLVNDQVCSRYNQLCTSHVGPHKEIHVCALN